MHFRMTQIRSLAQMTLRNGTWVVTTLSADQRLVGTLRDPMSLQDWPHSEFVHPLMHDFWVNDNRMLADRSAERVARFERIATDSARLLRAFFAAGVPLLAGTDTPMPRQTAGFALHDELEAMAAQGMPNLAVLQSATRLPAQWLGVAGRPRHRGRGQAGGPAAPRPRIPWRTSPTRAVSRR